MRFRTIISLLFCAACSVAAFADELQDRVARLLRDGQPDLALAMLEDHTQRGARLPDDLRLLRVRLQSDGERFDRLSSDFISQHPSDDVAAQALSFEVAVEQFARGQYVGALERLRSLPPEASERLPDLRLYIAMASQAVGELRTARQELESIPPRHPSYAMSRALLADLLLRQREAPLALEQAKLAWKADPDAVGAQSLYLQAAALTQLGKHEEAEEISADLSSRFPHSAEAARVPQSSTAPEARAPAEDEISEIASPERRGEFALQLGAFRDRTLALRLAERLRAQVAELRIEHDMAASPPWYRLVAGSYPTRAAAEAALKELRLRGIDSILLSPGPSGP